MKLFQTYLSPFPTRVRLAIYAQNIEGVEFVEPTGFHGDTSGKGDYLEVNPIGRIPALQLDDGRVLPESEVICEYLEECYPEPPLLPDDAWGRAQVRLISRLSDTYLVMAMLPLFNIVAEPPETWDQAKVRSHLSNVAEALTLIDHYIGDQGFAYGDKLTYADGTLLPMLQLVDEWLPIFRGESSWQAAPKTQAYWEAIKRNDICQKLVAETRQALQRSMGKDA